MRQPLGAFIAAKRVTDDRSARRRTSSTLAASGPHALPFTPDRHHLTWPQCQLATKLLARAEARRPFTGSPEQVRFRRALRIAGILSAVKRGVVGNSRFGRSLQGHHGGNVMRDHASSHLRQWSPVASLAARIARECRQAAAYFDATGEVLPIGAKPTESVEAQHLRTIQELWEAEQWMQQGPNPTLVSPAANSHVVLYL